MCHKLFQTYHCGHPKEICITPCPHALKSATPAPRTSLSTPSTPGSTPPTPATRTTTTTTATHSDTATLPSQHDRPPPPKPTTPPPVYRSSSPTPSEDEANRIPNICPYFFIRRLPESTHPCLVCYMKPHYEAYRKRWMDHYRGEHPGQNCERIEELAGVEQVAERVGLVNVVREMEKLRR